MATLRNKCVTKINLGLIQRLATFISNIFEVGHNIKIGCMMKLKLH